MGIDTWKVHNREYNKETNKAYEGIFAQGNGYLSIRGSYDEDLFNAPQNEKYWRMPANVTLEKQREPKSKWGVYVPGIVGSHPVLNEEMINLPYPLGLNIYIDNNRFDMEKSSYENYLRELDLKTGILKRKVTWIIKNNKVELEFSRFVSSVRRNIIVQHVKIKSIDEDMDIKIESFIDGDVTTNGYNHFISKDFDYNDGVIKCRVKTDLEDEVIMLSKLIISSKEGESFKVLNDRVINETNIRLTKGEEISVSKVSVIKTSRDNGASNLEEDARIVLRDSIDIQKLYSEHIEDWERKWFISDIEINGDDNSQLGLRFSIYHLLRSINEDDDRVAIDAKGVAGEAYFGHYFWDTEIYLLPFYLYTNPKAAKNLLNFRVNTLDGARKNAKEYGYNGAKYPWESTVSGLEQCSNWQYKDHEIHINGDIVYAMWNYYMVTKDEDLLINNFFPVMYEISRYFTQRVSLEEDGSYSIKGVMGPDEYLAFTNNNTFTNYMAKFALEKTLEVLEMIKTEDKVLYEKKVDCLNITVSELEKMKEIKDNINLPIDYDKEFIWQCDNFNDFDDVDFDKVWLDRNKPFGHFTSQERNYRSKALKQADVVGLMYLFNDDFNQDMIRNCINYYEPITTHDSSLSYIIHSIIYSRLGENDKAYEFFNKSLGIDLFNLGASEGIHIANCGGIWQAAVFGFCGLNNMMFNSEINMKPNLPKNWKRVKFKVMYNDKIHEIVVNHDGYEIL